MELEYVVSVGNLQITLPLYNKVNVIVNWDTNDENLVDTFIGAGNQFHTYDLPGTYRVKITGTLTQFGSGSSYTNSDRLTKVISFGNIGLTKLVGAFYNATNLISVPDTLPSEIISLSKTFYGASSFNDSNITTWDTSNITDMSYMFYNCSKFNQNISEWNVGNVVNMANLFNGAILFDQNLGNWNISNVLNMSSMFSSSLSTNNYNNLLIGWASNYRYRIKANVLDIGTTKYSYGDFNGDINEYEEYLNNNINIITDPKIARDILTDYSGLIINDGGIITPSGDPMIINIQIDFTDLNENEQYIFTLPLYGTLDVIIDWGLGIDPLNQISVFRYSRYRTSGDKEHYYRPINSNNIQTFTIKIYGSLQQLGNGNTSYLSSSKIINVSSWGNIGLESLSGAFNGASSLVSVPSTLLSTITNLDYTFKGATQFNQNLSGWDVSNVSSMISTFQNATSFNQNLGAWYFKSVTNMTNFLNGVSLSRSNYNNLLINFNLYPLKYNVNFHSGNNIYSYGNPSKTREKLRKVYNWTITDGGVQTDTDVELTYNSPMILEYEITENNQSISLPLFENVNAYIYWGDDNISLYTSPGNKSHTYLFPGTYNIKIYGTLTKFGNNNNINLKNGIDKLKRVISWGDLGIGFTSLSGAFYNATSLLSVPDTLPSTITNLDYTFYNATSFDQDLSNWDISNVLSFTDFLNNVSLSKTNYDNLLISWSQQNLKENIVFNGGNSKYSYGEPVIARQSIITNYGWTFIDGGIEDLPVGQPLTLVFQVEDNDIITLPLYGLINVSVYWDDLTKDIYSSEGDKTHTYINSGIYTVRIYGELEQFGNLFNSYSSMQKLISVSSFGEIGLQSLSGAFNNAINLTSIPATLPNTITITNLSYLFYNLSTFNLDITGWDTTFVEDMSYMFYNAKEFNQNIGSWNVSNVINMAYMFNYDGSGTSSFNQDISNWDVSKVVDLTNFLNGGKLSTSIYNSLLINWSNLSLQSNINFNAGSSIYSFNNPAIAKKNIRFNYNWTFIDGGVEEPNESTDPMILVFNVDVDISNQITLPLFQSVNVSIYWGDDTKSTYNTTGYKTHSYIFSDVYTVKIYGTLLQFGNGITPYNDVEKLISVSSFGNIQLQSLTGAFNNAINLISIPGTLPTTITNLSYLFYNSNTSNTSNFSNMNLNSWNTSNVINMKYMFYNAVLFNQPLLNWNTSNVTDMSYMFYNAQKFNQNINNWNVFKVVDMSYMFYNASSFNQNIGNWMTNNVTNMTHMFDGASDFNQNISYKRILGAWNVYKVVNMSYMFANALNFNQLINNWSVNNVINMSHMFYNAQDFNQNIGSWNVSKVSDMSYMLAGASKFNQSIINWNTISVINMQGMFKNAITFDISINYNELNNAWNTSNVTDMSQMFSGATNFNKNISGLITSNVIDMSYMFSDASRFNQYIGFWNTSKVINMYGMFMNATSFNQKIRYDSINDYWNTHLVEDMSYMFSGASSYNQNMNNWNVNNVSNMSNMFSDATNFEKNIGNWNIDNLIDATDFLKNVSLTKSNYDQLLIGWSSNSIIQSNVVFNGGDSIYSYGQASEAKQYLINNYNWDITDGGIEPFPSGNPMILEYETTDFNQTITLPLYQTVDVVVYWGDENRNSYNSFGDKNYTYFKPGTYTVQIYGTLEQFGNVSTPYDNADKLKKVISWGLIGLKNLSGAFYGASNLTEVPSSLIPSITHLDYTFYNAINFNDQNIIEWNVSNISRMEFTFYGASNFNQNIGSWNVSNVINMESMFENAVSFNQDLSSWNISNVLNFNNFLNNGFLSKINYDNILLSWAQLSLPSFITFNAGNSYYSYGIVSQIRQSIIDNYNWTIIDAGNTPLTTNPLILVFQVDIESNLTITLPLYNNVNVDIDWDDSNIQSCYVIGDLNHTYLNPGTYTVKIYGTLEQFGNGYTGYQNSEKIISLVDFGDLENELTSLSGAFNNAVNLISVPSNLPSNITDLSYCFFKSSQINDINISNWDISNVTNISFMFFYATSFNQSLISWDTTNITNLKYMLYGASSYDQPLSDWLLEKINNLG